ncbi:MAG TPA: PaaI family thioesterase [Ramlibacter sp.]|nr:PaaI family thioesterase [Ramlibacter sp.]
MTSPYTVTDTAEPGIPEGFRRLEAGGPYVRMMGPVYSRPVGDGTAIIALRVGQRHMNIQGVAHGGMLTTLADTALGINLSLVRGQRGGKVTASFTADFLSSARDGDWLEAHVTVTRVGKRLAYANCDLKVGDRHVLRSSAVFAMVERPLPPQGGEPPLEDG